MKLRVTGKKLPDLMKAGYAVDPNLGSVSFVVGASELPKAHGTFQQIVIGCTSFTSTLPWDRGLYGQLQRGAAQASHLRAEYLGCGRRLRSQPESRRLLPRDRRVI